MKRYLTVDETAEYLSFTPKSIRNMVARQEIPVIKRGRNLRFDVQDLDLWMRRQRVEARS